MPTAPEVYVVRDPDAEPVPVTGGFALPSRFYAEITPSEPRLPICHLELVVEYGRAVCNGLRLERRPGGGPITGTELRGVPVADYVRRAADELLRVVMPKPEEPVTWTDPTFGSIPADSEPFDSTHVAVRLGGGLTLTREYREITRSPRKRGRVTDDTLRNVAEIYRAACFWTAAPTNAVRDQLGVSRATAGRWVSMARQRGFLGATQPGVAGESTARS